MKKFHTSLFKSYINYKTSKREYHSLNFKPSVTENYSTKLVKNIKREYIYHRMHTVARPFIRAATVPIRHTKGVLIPKRGVSFHVDDANVIKSTYESSKVNPFVKLSKKKVTQHPSFGRDTCDVENCKWKICDTPCGNVVLKETVGHGTHNPNFPGAVQLSQTDLDNNPARPQCAVLYNEPVINHDTIGQNVNAAQTKVLNNDADMQANLYYKSSRKPPVNHLEYGSDNFDENIN